MPSSLHRLPRIQQRDYAPPAYGTEIPTRVDDEGCRAARTYRHIGQRKSEGEASRPSPAAMTGDRHHLEVIGLEVLHRAAGRAIGRTGGGEVDVGVATLDRREEVIHRLALERAGEIRRGDRAATHDAADVAGTPFLPEVDNDRAVDATATEVDRGLLRVRDHAHVDGVVH